MRTCIVINPHAGSAEQAEVLQDLLDQLPNVDSLSCGEPGHGTTLAQRAVEEGYERVVAAGGDGTINEVVRGLVEAGAKRRVELGVLPLGTGNDLARTLALPEDLRDALAILERGRTEAFDLVEVDADDYHGWAINASSGGFSGQVDENMTSEEKKRWGPMAYFFGAAAAAADLQAYDARVTVDGDEVIEERVLNVVVANGRTIGGGRRVAPYANPCDGLLDIVIVRWAPMLDLAEVGTRLVAGNYLESPNVMHRKARRVRVESEPGMWFNVDGELVSQEPIAFTVHAGRLPVVVGPGFTAEPPDPSQVQT